MGIVIFVVGALLGGGAGFCIGKLQEMEKTAPKKSLSKRWAGFRLFEVSFAFFSEVHFNDSDRAAYSKRCDEISPRIKETLDLFYGKGVERMAKQDHFVQDRCEEIIAFMSDFLQKRIDGVRFVSPYPEDYYPSEQDVLDYWAGLDKTVIGGIDFPTCDQWSLQKSSLSALFARTLALVCASREINGPNDKVSLEDINRGTNLLWGSIPLGVDKAGNLVLMVA